MPLSFVGAASNSAANGGDVTVTLPSMQEGDVVYPLAGSGGIGDPISVSTTGYTTLDFNGGALSTILARKVQGGTPDSSVTVAGSGSALDGMSVAVHVWRGADATTTEDATTVEASGSGDPDSPSITTVTDDAVVLTAVASEDDAFTTFNAPTGYGNTVTETVSEARTGTVGIASKAVTTAGAENPGAWDTDFGGTQNYFAYTVAIRPAAAGGDETTGSASGSATVSGTGAATAESAASSSGVASVSGVGASTAKAAGSSVGVATVSGVGLEGGLSESVGSSAGIATVSGVGAAEFAAAFASQGTATVTGVGAQSTTVEAVASASGIAVVLGVGSVAPVITDTDILELPVDFWLAENIPLKEIVNEVELFPGKAGEKTVAKSGGSMGGKTDVTVTTSKRGFH